MNDGTSEDMSYDFGAYNTIFGRPKNNTSFWPFECVIEYLYETST